MDSKCMDINTVNSFCECIGSEEKFDPATADFCTWANNDPKVTDEDLAELKMALEENDCCDGC